MSGAASRAPLIEIFHSIQGEGRFVGVPMTFVRVATCPLRCRYCDTPHSYTAQPRFRVALHGAPRDEPNPVTAARAVELAVAVAEHSPWRDPADPLRVSLTGGEPLVVPAFVREFGALLAAHGGHVHLETAALDATALAGVLPAITHLSADYKLPETLAAGDHRQDHVACVAAAVAFGGVSVDVKIVLTADSSPASFQRALDDLAPFRDAVLLVLQPVTPFGAVTQRLSATALEDRAARAGAAGFRFRVIPQTHKALGVE